MTQHRRLSQTLAFLLVLALSLPSPVLCPPAAPVAQGDPSPAALFGAWHFQKGARHLFELGASSLRSLSFVRHRTWRTREPCPLALRIAGSGHPLAGAAGGQCLDGPAAAANGCRTTALWLALRPRAGGLEEETSTTRALRTSLAAGSEPLDLARDELRRRAGAEETYGPTPEQVAVRETAIRMLQAAAEKAAPQVVVFVQPVVKQTVLSDGRRLAEVIALIQEALSVTPAPGRLFVLPEQSSELLQTLAILEWRSGLTTFPLVFYAFDSEEAERYVALLKIRSGYGKAEISVTEISGADEHADRFVETLMGNLGLSDPDGKLREAVLAAVGFEEVTQYL